MVTVWGPSGTTLLFFVIPQYKDLAGWGWEQFRALAAQHCFFKSVIPRYKDLAGWGWEQFGTLAAQPVLWSRSNLDRLRFGLPAPAPAPAPDNYIFVTQI